MANSTLNIADLSWAAVLAQHIFPTLGLLRVGTSDHWLLAERVDVRDHWSLLRLAQVPGQQAAATLASLAKGSCDIHRAGAELQHLGNQAQVLDELLLLQANELHALVPTGDLVVPAGPWHSLACDGQLIDAVQPYLS